MTGKNKNAGFFTRMRLSFSGKVFISVLGLLVMLTVTMNLFYLRSQNENFKNEIYRDGSLMAAILSSNARLAIFTRNQQQLEDLVQTAFSMTKVVGVCVYGSDGNLLAHESVPGWDENAICRKPGNLPTDLANFSGNASGIHHLEAKETIQFWSPVLAGPKEFSEESLYFNSNDTDRSARLHNIGLVGVVFDKRSIQKSIQGILIRNLSILLLFLIIGFAAAYYIVQGVSRPLNHLIAKIREHGDNVESKDELGMLEDTFSGMVNTIGDSFATISELKQGLEKKVEELEHEIGKRRQIEVDLRESEEKFRNISEGIADGVAVLVDEKISWCNQAFCDIYGCRVSEMPGTEAKKIMPELADVQSSMNDGEQHRRYQTAARKTNNQKIFVEVRVQKIIFENRDATQVIVRDVTDLEKAEEKRKILEVKALGQSKLASLGKIATSVAHEINQPLSYIKIAYGSLLRDLENNMFDPDEAREYCTESLRQVERITMITDHLRSFGRTDGSVFSDIQLPDVLTHSLTLMRESLRLANITLLQDIDDNLPSVKGNSVKFEQVIINLFQNSIDAMAESSEKKILITMHQAGAMVEICFADTGPGIMQDVLEHIFEPFFTTKKLEDRTGLGLGIVNNIIREHNGTIDYRPKEGWGANFVILLPGNK